jgi:hypothetical protein
VRTLVPNLIDQNGVAHYVEAGSTSLADLKASVSLKRTAPNNRGKFTFKVSLPTVATETINGVASPKLLRTCYAELTMTCEASSTAQERGDLLRIVLNALGTADTNTWSVWKDQLGIY